MAGALSGVGPTAQAVHIDGPLTNIAVAYRNGAYISEQVLPNVPVLKQSDLYWIFTKVDWFRNNVDRRAPGTRAQRADYGLSTSSYLCEVYALAKGVPDEVVKNADNPLRPLAEATEWLSDQILLNKEIKVADVVFGNSQWSSSATPTTLWDVDTSNPIGDVATATVTIEQNIGRPANVGVIGGDLWRHLKMHPDLIDRIKGAATPGGPAILSQGAIGALFEIENLLIGRGMKDTSAEGTAATRARIWGLHMAILFRTPTPSLRTANAGYVFTWEGRSANRYREDQEHQDVVEVGEAFDVKLIATDAGYLIKSAASS